MRLFETESIERQSLAPELHEAAPLGPLLRGGRGVSYDGGGFRGFADQPGQRTVAGALRQALGAVIGVAPVLTCAGRTDAGVHASCQVVHFDCESERLSRYRDEQPGLSRLARSLSAQLGPEVVVFRAELAPAGFHARHSATYRRYRYEISTGRVDPLRRNRTWQLDSPLDVAAMRLGADPFIGTHDFSGFCRRPKDEAQTEPLLRTVSEAHWRIGEDGTLLFEIAARSFCHQMVRSIVGILVAIGMGKARPSDVVERLREGTRRGAPAPAPAGGLCLVEVGYPSELGGSWK